MSLSNLLLGGWRKITEGKEPSLPEVSTARYEFLEGVVVATTGYVNRTGRFIVILGTESTAQYQVRRGTTIVNTTLLAASVVTQSTEPVGPAQIVTLEVGGGSSILATNSVWRQWRSMLLPPGYNFFSISTLVQFYGVVCRTLDDAVKIL